ncbi:MAG: TIGR04282 family arsenosugar biosynthesis glycosyltransferase [Deltaproteobacteria bacterium]|nr:TIGR04282 family arsenosugar biosynthesis glycosyltransferase [Deltaproteobacteria bacterium]MDA8308324.1 TIGR04282 family arsenosugar biosynthesis glycosyltransferase [Deltaproteobacteria bacterium]
MKLYPEVSEDKSTAGAARSCRQLKLPGAMGLAGDKNRRRCCRDNKALLIFLRYPAPGKVKSRLSAEVGAEKAVEIYEKLLRRTLGIACDVKRKSPEIGITLFYTPQDPLEKLMNKFRGPWKFRPQEGDHLGERMAKGLRSAFAEGAGRAVLIGSDLADVEPGDIEEAFRNSGEKVAVLGPAADGGFYLVGTDRPIDSPFGFSTWGTNEIFNRTAGQFEAEGFRVHPAPQRNDVDCKSDLERLDRDPLFSESISIIIPTLSEAEKLSPLLHYLEDAIWPGDEIVVVEGGACEKTSFRRISPVLTVIKTIKGRGIQQNIGAMLSRGNILFFLHDDTIPPPEFAYLIRRTCRDKPSAPGCFRLRFLPSSRALDLISKWANLRTALFKLPYGDQGYFLRKELFEGAGGFRRTYLMEDVEIVRNLRKISGAGSAVSIMPADVYTSPDRYLRKGILKASLQNHLLFLLSLLGRDERELYRKYYRPEIPMQ